MNPARQNRLDKGWLEGLLHDNLRPTTAPDGLWERVWGPNEANKPKFRLNWAAAGFGAAALVTAALIATVAMPVLDRAHETVVADRVLQSGDPAAIRAWVKNSTGIDVPLTKALPSTIQLVEARTRDNGAAEILFRLDGHETVLNVSFARGPKPVAQHQQGQRTWQARGVDYELQGGPTKVDTACLLCHAVI